MCICVCTCISECILLIDAWLFVDLTVDRSEKEWQIRVKKMWKAIPPELSEKIEAAYRDPAMQGKEKKPLPETEHEVSL